MPRQYGVNVITLEENQALADYLRNNVSPKLEETAKEIGINQATLRKILEGRSIKMWRIRLKIERWIQSRAALPVKPSLNANSLCL